ncbi:hypothetical protein G7046_g2574 [Stylonectria norvegica]|nr:hypothetical protein G7046_g2574 [Stylonectria norvegica]
MDINEVPKSKPLPATASPESEWADLVKDAFENWATKLSQDDLQVWQKQAENLKISKSTNKVYNHPFAKNTERIAWPHAFFLKVMFGVDRFLALTAAIYLQARYPKADIARDDVNEAGPTTDERFRKNDKLKTIGNMLLEEHHLKELNAWTGGKTDKPQEAGTESKLLKATKKRVAPKQAEEYPAKRVAPGLASGTPGVETWLSARLENDTLMTQMLRRMSDDIRQLKADRDQERAEMKRELTRLESRLEDIEVQQNKPWRPIGFVSKATARAEAHYWKLELQNIQESEADDARLQNEVDQIVKDRKMDQMRREQAEAKAKAEHLKANAKASADHPKPSTDSPKPLTDPPRTHPDAPPDDPKAPTDIKTADAVTRPDDPDDPKAPTDDPEVPTDGTAGEPKAPTGRPAFKPHEGADPL